VIYLLRHGDAEDGDGDDAARRLTPKGEREDGSDEQSFDKLRDAYYWSRLLSGDEQLTVNKAAKLRSKAVVHANGISKAAPAGTTRGGDWLSQGPDPIVQVGRTSNTFEAVSGRIGALAIRNDGTIILGAAQGGVWTYDPASGTWTPRSNATDTQSVGALAIAPDRVCTTSGIASPSERCSTGIAKARTSSSSSRSSPPISATPAYATPIGISRLARS